MIASLEWETPQNAERGIETGIPFEVDSRISTDKLLESFRFGDPRPNEAIILGSRCRAEVLPSPSRYRVMQ